MFRVRRVMAHYGQLIEASVAAVWPRPLFLLMGDVSARSSCPPPIDRGHIGVWCNIHTHPSPDLQGRRGGVRRKRRRCAIRTTVLISIDGDRPTVCNRHVRLSRAPPAPNAAAH